MALDQYVLATGTAGEARLKVVNSVHGQDTENFLQQIGLRAGMHVAEIGCGTGNITRHIARVVGKSGSVTGVDISSAQVAVALASSKKFNLKQMEFRVAGAYDTGLQRDRYDLVFSRFMLMHLQRPVDALIEMKAILKIGGTLAVEDGDFYSPYCEPASPAFTRAFELYRQLLEHSGADVTLGQRLHGLVAEAGFLNVESQFVQPKFNKGDERRLPEWTLEESAPKLIDAGLISEPELAELLAEMKSLLDEDRLFAMAKMTQVWAEKTT